MRVVDADFFFTLKNSLLDISSLENFFKNAVDPLREKKVFTKEQLTAAIAP